MAGVRWTEWFALVSGAIYLPLELYEVIVHKNALVYGCCWAISPSLVTGIYYFERGLCNSAIHRGKMAQQEG